MEVPKDARKKLSAGSKVRLSFEDIKYSVQEKAGPKPILKGINGSVGGGECLCVLGPSGSGKTSLIHILAHRIRTAGAHSVEGAVKCNGRAVTASQFQRISGLVTQEDIFNAALSVRETLSFSARLRLPAAQRSARVAEVIAVLQLGDCASTKVGDDSNPYLKGISGGEKRRLAIASEILDPNIAVLVLDEPTSGLDAAAALLVAKLLRNLADSGLAVVATLHQPRSSIVACMDQLMVLAKAQQVFYGSLPEYVPYLTDTLKGEVPLHESPYDFLLDLLNETVGGDIRVNVQALTEAAGSDDIADTLASVYASSDLRRRMDVVKAPDAADDQGLELIFSARSGPRVGWLGQFFTVLQRTTLIKLRDPVAGMTQFSTAIFMGLIFGSIYWQCYEKATQFAILDAQMAVTITVVMTCFLPFDVVLTFPLERRIFLRERKAGLYCSSALFFARILADLPQHLVAAALMALIIYPMAGLRMGLGVFVLLNMYAILVGAAVMQATGALCRTFEEANMLVILVLMMSMMLSSAFVREVPVFLEWAREISLMGLLGDVCSYLEFKHLAVEGVSLEEIAAQYGLLKKSEEDANAALLILLYIFLAARLLTFLAVKFMHTGQTFSENLWT